MSTNKAKQIYKESEKLIKRHQKSRFIAIVTIIAILALTIIIGGEEISVLLFSRLEISIAVLALIYWTITRKSKSTLENYRIKLKKLIVNEIIEEQKIYVKYDVNGKIRQNFEYNCSDIVPSFDRYLSEDLIYGTTQSGRKFSFYEIVLKEKRDKKVVTVFDGHCIEIKHNWKLKNNIIIKPDNALLKLITSSKDQIKLESTEFEKKFDVFSSDQIEARTILTPKFMNTINTLTDQNIYSMKITDNKIIITSKRKHDYFDIGKFTQPINIIKFRKQIRNDLLNILGCIDEIT